MHSSHLALAHSRQDDLLREAERHRLAAAARRDGVTLRARFAAFLRRPEPAPTEAPQQVAPAAK